MAPMGRVGRRALPEAGPPGYALMISGTEYLADPSTATLLSESATAGGKYGATTYLKVGWNNEAP